MFSKLSSGSTLHLMSFKFNSTAELARQRGSIEDLRSAMRGRCLPLPSRSHPTASTAPLPLDPEIDSIRFLHHSLNCGINKSKMLHRSASILQPFELLRIHKTRISVTFHRIWARSARLRRHQPGCSILFDVSATTKITGKSRQEYWVPSSSWLQSSSQEESGWAWYVELRLSKRRNQHGSPWRPPIIKVRID